MKKAVLITTALFLSSMVSCSDKKESSLPQVKTEIYGNSSTESGVQADDSNDIITLNYAVYGQIESEEYELIKKFNDADNGYVIATKDYSEIIGADESGQVVYDEDKRQTFQIMLMNDISNGEIDIVRDYYLGESQIMNRLSARGAFIDLYEFMDKDSEVNKSTLNSHILYLHETDGKLYTLPTYYTFDTLVGQTRYVGEKEGWTLDEFISCWEQMPEGSVIEGHNEKDYIYRTILRSMISSFIDYENAKVYFDSPQFKKALEFCNTFEKVGDTYSDPNFNSVNFVSSKRFYGFANSHLDLWNETNDTYTFVGYPSEDGCGGFIDTRGNRYAICSSTTDAEREGAWEFIRNYCLDDYQVAHYCKTEQMSINGEVKEVYLEPVGFPINLNVYDQLATDAMAGKHMSDTITKGGIEFEVGQLTQNELDRITNYINRIQNLSCSIDSDIEDVIDEEVLAYFNNKSSVEDCINVIQNRASIIVSERQ